MTTSTSGLMAVSVFFAESTLRSPMRSMLWRIWRCRFERVDDVHVDDAERADAGGGEVERGRGAEAAGAEQQDARVEKLQLPSMSTSGSSRWRW